LQNQAGTGPTNPFNGDILVHQIENDYVTDNSDSITAMERKFETMVRWRSETIVQWIDRFEAPLAELEVALRDGLNLYQEDELVYLWKQTFSDNISGDEIQVINTHMHRYVKANSLQDVTDYLDGVFDTQLFRSLCVDIARFLPSRYMSQTGALCKPIATALSASNCCKCLANLIMTLRYYPPQKRNENGKHLRLRPKIGPIRSEFSCFCGIKNPNFYLFFFFVFVKS
jgi:hypothetical protein